MDRAETVAAYIAAWNELDPARRDALLQQSWVDDGVYSDRFDVAEGRDALSELIGDYLTARIPGARLLLASGVDGHHEFVRFRWRIERPEGAPIEGFDVGELAPDGRLHRITGFSGPFAEEHG